MSGHSKWSTIKHKKAATDAKRGKIFTKLIREITIAARQGGGDINANPRLRIVVQKAREQNMPSDNVDRAIKKGTGELEGVEYHELRYEGYGPEGVAILVDILTDNKNRTAAEIRSIFSKNNGSLGETGCVSWIFTKKGIINVDASKYTEDQLFEVAIDAGADDVIKDGESFLIKTSPDVYHQVLDKLKGKIEYLSAEMVMDPSTTVKLTGDPAKKVLKLIEELEDQDDVQNVHANFDIDESEME